MGTANNPQILPRFPCLSRADRKHPRANKFKRTNGAEAVPRPTSKGAIRNAA